MEHLHAMLLACDDISAHQPCGLSCTIHKANIKRGDVPPLAQLAQRWLAPCDEVVVPTSASATSVLATEAELILAVLALPLTVPAVLMHNFKQQGQQLCCLRATTLGWF